MPLPRSPRLAAIAAAGVILLAGLLVRSTSSGVFAKYAGVALYGALIYALVLALAPATAPWITGAVALTICWAIELAQLTAIPAVLSARSMLARLVLGSTFNPPDLIWYAVGVAIMACTHRLAVAKLLP